jgi:hypothetical protein
MSQNDFVVANAGGATVRADINSALQALASLSSGNSSPGTTYSGQLWWDTTNNKIKIRNSANSAWIEVFDFDGSTISLASTDFPTLGFPDQGELTISSGSITSTGVYHTVDTESDAASDDLDTITAGSDGQLLIIRPENDGRTVVIKDGTGNIQTPLGNDLTLDSTDKAAVLIYDTAKSVWLVLAGPAEIATQSQAETGTDSTTLMTPERTKQAIAAQTSKSIGDGQTWTDVSASRSASTTYTNSTGTSITVIITKRDNEASGGLSVSVDSLKIAEDILVVSGDLTTTISFIVPDGSTYEVTKNAAIQISNWVELR